jgi:hypothetical protein
LDRFFQACDQQKIEDYESTIGGDGDHSSGAQRRQPLGMSNIIGAAVGNQQAKWLKWPLGVVKSKFFSCHVADYNTS